MGNFISIMKPNTHIRATTGQDINTRYKKQKTGEKIF